MSYTWLDPNIVDPVGYGSGGLNLQSITPYDDTDRAVGSGNLISSGGLTGYEIHNNFLNLGEVALNTFNRVVTLELGQQSVVGSDVYKGTVLYTGRKNSYGTFFAGGQAVLIGAVDTTGGAFYGGGGTLTQDLEFKIGVNTDSLYTVTIPNAGGGLITGQATLLTKLNAALLNDSVNTAQLINGFSRGLVTWYGFTSLGAYANVSIANGDTFTILFDDDTVRYSYTYTYASPDGVTALPITSKTMFINFLNSVISQATSDADPGLDVPAITKFIPATPFEAIGAGDRIKFTLQSKVVDTDGTSKGSLTVNITGAIATKAKFTTTDITGSPTLLASAFNFSPVITITKQATTEFLIITGENNESSTIVISNSAIFDTIAVFYILQCVASGTYEQLDHTKAPAISADADTAFGTQLLYGGPFIVPKLTVTDDWEDVSIKIHPSASTATEKQGALYISLNPYDVTDETATMVYGGVFSPGNLAIPLYATTGGNPPTPSPEYSKTIYNTNDHKLYIYDTVDNVWRSADLFGSQCAFYDDFLGFKLNKLIAGENTSAPWGVVETDTPEITLVANTANGIVQITLDADDNTEDGVLYWGDQLSLGATQGLIFEARVALHVLPMAGGGVEPVRAIFGLASANNATKDSVTVNAWFRIESSANTVLLYESDDTATDDDDNSAGVTIVIDTYHIYRIDLTDKTAVKFYVDNALVGTTSMSALSTAHLVQPFFSMSKTKAAANTGVGTMYIDSVKVWTNKA